MRNRNTANSSMVDVYTDLLVLKSSQLDQNLGGGMLDLQELEDGGPVVGDGHIPDVVHQHLVQADGAQAGLDNIGNAARCHHILGPRQA